MTTTPTTPPAAASIQQPPRQFRIGSTNLADPDPTMTPKQVIDLYSASYPALKFATIEEPRIEGEMLVIEAKLPTVQTKGAAASAADPLDRLRDWMCAPAQSPTASARWSPVYAFLDRKLRDPAQPNIDPFLLPLA